MRRTLLIALAVIVALGAVGFAVIAGVTRDGGHRAAGPSMAPPAEVVAPPPAPAPAAPAEVASGSGVMGRPAPPPLAVAPPPPPPPPPPPRDSWESVEPAGRPADLGAIGPGFMMAMRNTATGRLATCFDEVVEARNAATGAVPAATRDPNVTAIGAPPVLMLELETRAGAVVIVDAPVESQGTAGDGTILCAQRALRGLTLSVPAARDGERHRLRWPLTR